MNETRVELADEIDINVPNVARVYDFLLGGGIAQAADPRCRVVYVDKYRVAAPHSQMLLQDNDKVAAIQADVRDPERIFRHAETRVVGMFAGFELVDPGVVTCAAWHPTGPGDYSPISDANALFYAGIGRRPSTLELNQ